MHKVIVISLWLSLVINLFASELMLKKGWNLVGIESVDKVSILNLNQHILKATGGGVGGGGDFRYDRNFAKYASGTMKLGQGYWIKTDVDTNLTYTESSRTIDTIELKKGWNLINSCISLDSSKLFNTYPHILKATGGGVGGGGDFRYDRNFAKYASGITKVGQGYWIKADSAFNIVCAVTYDYRAWGMGGDDTNSKLTVMVNGVNYTLIPYSQLNIEQSNTSTAGDITTFIGTLNSKDLNNTFTISDDYNRHKIVIKVYKGKTTFTKETLITTSKELTANNAYTSYNINIKNADDFRPLSPTDTNIDMPPVAPSF